MDLIAGQAQVMISTTGSSLQYAKAGAISSALAVSHCPAHRRAMAELLWPIPKSGPRWCSSPACTSIGLCAITAIQVVMGPR